MCYPLSMASNFDFLENVDRELFSNIEEAQKLFRDEYFNQSMVQIRIFAEKMAKKILNSDDNLTFDDTLNCLKDKVKTDKEKEFIEDLFFIKQEGNKCAHGEDASAITVLEAIKRAYEASINYANAKLKTSKFDKLNFDETMLITTKPLRENTIVEKYVELAQQEKEELLNRKQSELVSETKKPKKALSPEKQRVKEKIKNAKKNLKQNINKTQKQKKAKKSQKSNNSKLLMTIIFIIFVIISLFFLTKMIFIF